MRWFNRHMVMVQDWFRGTVINGCWHRGSSGVENWHMRCNRLPGR